MSSSFTVPVSATVLRTAEALEIQMVQSDLSDATARTATQVSVLAAAPGYIEYREVLPSGRTIPTTPAHSGYPARPSFSRADAAVPPPPEGVLPPGNPLVEPQETVIPGTPVHEDAARASIRFSSISSLADVPDVLIPPPPEGADIPAPVHQACLYGNCQACIEELVPARVAIDPDMIVLEAAPQRAAGAPRISAAEQIRRLAIIALKTAGLNKKVAHREKIETKQADIKKQRTLAALEKTIRESLNDLDKLSTRTCMIISRTPKDPNVIRAIEIFSTQAKETLLNHREDLIEMYGLSEDNVDRILETLAFGTKIHTQAEIRAVSTSVNKALVTLIETGRSALASKKRS